MTFDTAVRVALILAFALAAMPLLKRRSASARRLVLAASFVASLVVPFAPKRAVSVERPAVVQQLAATVLSEPAVEGPATAKTPESSPPSPIHWLAVLWILGAVVVGGRSAFGFVAAERLVRKSRPSSTWPSDVRVSTSIDAPAVAGIANPVILIPSSAEEWPADRKEAVLLHERSHIEAHDLRVQLVASLVCAIHWFNPFVWLAARRLRLEREIAADEAALGTGILPTSYAQDLLSIAGNAPLGTIAISEKPLTTRIKAIVANTRPRSLTVMGKSTLLVTSSLIALGVACTNVKEATPITTTSAPIVPAPAPASSPAHVQTSADVDALLEIELRRTIAEWHAAGGAILVMKPSGEVVGEAGDVDRQVAVGSVMKPFLLATAFEHALVNESDTFDASATTKAPVGELLAKSNNVGFTRMFERVGAEKHRATLERFGFAVPPAVDANLAIGGTMTGTPRQVAKAYATLANGGGNVVSKQTADRVTKLLEGVVSSNEGTGKKARLEGARIAGKTGTSEWTADASKHTYASFVGYAPAEQPRVVVYVGIESPTGENPWGGEVAAPVFARVARSALSN